VKVGYSGQRWEWRTRVRSRYRIQVPAVLRPLLLASGIGPGVFVEVGVMPVEGWGSVYWITRMPSEWRITIPEVYRDEYLKPGELVEVSLRLVLKPEEVSEDDKKRL